MSDYESHKGTLHPTEYTKREIVEEFINNYQDTEYISDYKDKELTDDIIADIWWEIDNYIEVQGKIYRVQDTQFDPDSDIFEMEENEDGTLDYHLRYYNGGCGFQEAMETAARKLKG